MDRHSDIFVTYLAMLFILLSVFLSFFTLYETRELITGRAAGQLEMCINNMPVLNTSNCSVNLTQDVAYHCVMNATDEDGDNLTFTSVFITDNTVFTISSLGVIGFTPGNDDVGNHTVNISANDYK